jgi:glycosyltransferase involved in cell wall biosynthesis
LKRGRVVLHVINKILLFNPLLYPFAWRFIKRTIERINPDVIHALGTFPHTTIATLLRNKYPALITVFSLSRREIRFERNPIRVLRKILVSIPNEGYVIPRIPHIILQSKFTENLLKDWTKSRLHIVPEGVEYGRLQEIQADASLGETPDIFIAVNFRKLKGLDVLIRAVSKVVESIPEIMLYIAGAGEKGEELKNLVKELALDNNVKFLGFIADETTKYRYYKACRLVVVPSRWDVEPYAALDGAASGKPVIASDACNTSVVVDGKTGYIFKSEDVEALASKIVKLLTDEKLREEMGQAALEKAKEYNWDSIATRTVEIYTIVIDSFMSQRMLR